MKINFVWQGVSDKEIFKAWQDGLREAMKIIEKKHKVKYCEPYDNLDGADLILYWEAPCTINGDNKAHYLNVKNHSTRKALLFAGGPIKAEWVDGFDHVFVESAINKDEFDALGIENSTAFGINTKAMRPIRKKKIYDAIHQGACASWKRQWLLGEAFGDKAVLCGRFQESDPRPFDEARKHGVTILEHMPADELARLLNQCVCLAQTSDYWGGGQRATLEAMACNVPPIVMTDSPKNREYVEESGYGMICNPKKEDIKTAQYNISLWEQEDINKGRDYVLSKWSHEHYAESLLNWIES